MVVRITVLTDHFRDLIFYFLSQFRQLEVRSRCLRRTEVSSVEFNLQNINKLFFALNNLIVSVGLSARQQSRNAINPQLQF